MKTRLASLFLLLLLAGNTFAGVPVHPGEAECSMDEVMEMDCCKAALMQELTPEVADAKLCCALNCTQNGTTSPPNIVRVKPPPVAGSSSHPALTRPLDANYFLFRRIDLHPPPDSAPAYLLNLALLI